VDPLTQLVDMLHPNALVWKTMLARGAWAWRFPADDGVVFGRVVHGCCRFELPETGEQTLEAGDYLLLTRPPAWTLRGGDGDAVVVDLEVVLSETASGEPEGREDGPDHVRVVGGHFVFDSTNTELLTGFLAPVLHLRASGPGMSGRLAGVFAMIDAEASASRPCQEAVLSRLLEIVLIELLRAPEMMADQQRGMLIGLTDPQVAAALRAFHADIRRNWSVSSMAAVAHMSRSVFSQRFTALVGQPPMTYALRWRMAVARDALTFGGQSVDDVALAIGYGSTSAFSTAFTRTVGRSPARFARDALATPQRRSRPLRG